MFRLLLLLILIGITLWLWRRFQPQKMAAAMSEEEARHILGLSQDATEEEIIEAHRRLISRLHPDRGGSPYLAAKINQAKEILLKRLTKK